MVERGLHSAGGPTPQGHRATTYVERNVQFPKCQDVYAMRPVGKRRTGFAQSPAGADL